MNPTREICWGVLVNHFIAVHNMAFERQELDVDMALRCIAAWGLLRDDPREKVQQRRIDLAASLEHTDLLVRIEEELNRDGSGCWDLDHYWPEDAIPRELERGLHQLMKIAGLQVACVPQTMLWTKCDHLLERAELEAQLHPRRFIPIAEAAGTLADNLDLDDDHPVAKLLQTIADAETIANNRLPRASVRTAFLMARAQYSKERGEE